MSLRLFILLVLASTISAQGQPKPRPAARPTLQGRVINQITGRPIPEAIVTLMRPPNRYEVPSATRVTTSDAQGWFSLWAVPEGGYIITAERNGFVDTRTTKWYLKVPREPDDQIVFKLVPPAIVRGRVVDEDGDVAPHASVSLLGGKFFGSTRNYESTNEARVRDDGTFVLGGIRPGHYYLSASSLTNITGAAELRLSRITLETFYPDATDITSAQLLEVRPGQQIDGITIRLRSERIYRVRGRLEGIERDQFGFLSLDGRGWYSGRRPLFDSAETFEIMLRAGNYLIGGTATPKTRLGFIVSIYQKLIVRKDMDDVVIRAADPGTMVHGTVHDERGGYPDLNGAHMSFQLAGTASKFKWTIQDYNVSGDGSFSGSDIPLNVVQGGEVRAILYLPKPEYFVKSIRFNGSDVTNRLFEVPLEGGEFDVAISSGAAGVSGVAQTAKGRDAGEGFVTIWSTEQPADGSRGFSATANLSNGTFKFENLPPGDYLMAAWEEIEQGLAEYPEFFKAFAPAATRLTLEAGARETVTVTAIPRDAWEAQGAKLR